MKPTKLVLSGFGPFAEETEVCFQELAGRGLFLVTGDTGSGKTTLFDAICFALFGEVSGSVRTIDSVRSHFAPEQQKTFVTLEFEHKGKKYQVKRSPSYTKKRKKGDGVTTKSADADLTLPDQTVVTGYRKVTSAIENVLGITAKQFKQIVMVAQGEFLELLLAESNERSLILRRIFETNLYSNLQEILKEEERKNRQTLHLIEQEVMRYIQESIPVSEKEDAPEENLYGAPTVMEQLKQWILEDQSQEKIIINRKKECAKSLEKTIQMQTIGEQNNHLLDELEKMQKKQEKISKQKLGMEEQKGQLEIQKKAVYFVLPKERFWLREQEEKETLEKKIQELKKTYSSQKEVISHCQTKWDKAQKLQPELEKLEEIITKLKQQQPLYEKVEILTKQWNEKVGAQTQEQAMVHQLEEQQTQKKLQLEKISQCLESLQNIETDQVRAEGEYEKSMQQRDKTQELMDTFEKIELEKETLPRLQEKFSVAEAEYQQQKDAYDAAETIFFREQAGILAEKLEDGVPCPVCGSKEHPHKAKKSGKALSEDELQQKKQERDDAWSELQRQTSACHAKKTSIEIQEQEWLKHTTSLYPEVQHVLEQDRKEFMKNKQESAEEQEHQWLEKKTEFAQKLENKRNQQQKQEQCQKDIKVLQKQMEEKNHTLTEYTLDVEKTKSAFETIQMDLEYASFQEMKQVLLTKQQEYTQLKNKLKQTEEALAEANNKQEKNLAVLTDNESKLEQIKEKCQEFKKAFLSELEKYHFSNPESYRKMLCSEEKLEKKTQEITQFLKQYEQLETTLQHLSKEAQGKELVDLQALQEKQEEENRNIAELEDTLKTISLRLQRNRETREKLKSVLEKKQHAEEQYLLVSQLSKTASGELAGKGKLSFEQYVQTFYFDHIVKEANGKLLAMSEGRYALKRKETAGDLRSQYGLDLEVIDYYTGRSRSVKSLSGGESFQASLSLALGLSEVMQQQAGGIELDTMFIDEGFGSLDEDSLEQAIEILQKLSYGNRMIGIISHVSELKERIDHKIVVTRGKYGSHIQVISEGTV